MTPHIRGATASGLAARLGMAHHCWRPPLRGVRERRYSRGGRFASIYFGPRKHREIKQEHSVPMDFNWSPEQEKYRAEVRSWLETKRPSPLGKNDDPGFAGHDAPRERLNQGAQRPIETRRGG